MAIEPDIRMIAQLLSQASEHSAPSHQRGFFGPSLRNTNDSIKWIAASSADGLEQYALHRDVDLFREHIGAEDADAVVLAISPDMFADKVYVFSRDLDCNRTRGRCAVV